MTKLRLGPQLELSADAAEHTFGILGIRGSGKSNAAVVMAEEMFDAGIPWIVFDTKGDWYGIARAGAKAKGLPVPVLGGVHGVRPLEATAGRLVADLAFERNVSLVLDLSEMSKADHRRFLVPFARQLLTRHRREPTVRHVFFEEAHDYLPQTVTGDKAEAHEAVSALVLKGRAFGLGSSVLSQRSARIHKDVLEESDTLLAFRTQGPNDRKAIKGWVDVHDVDSSLVDSLPSLGDGECWLWSPHVLGKVERVQFRRRRTYDSGSIRGRTDVRQAKAATIADIDLEALDAAMADTIEKAKADDPSELRRRIRTLEREVRDAERARVAAEPKVERVEVPMVPEGLEKQLREVLDGLGRAGADLSVLADQASTALSSLRGLRTVPDDTLRRRAEPTARRRSRGPAEHGRGTSPRAAGATAPRGTRPPASSGPTDEISRPQQTILDALAWLRGVGQDPARRTAVGLIAGYSATSGGFNNLLGALRSAGLIDYPQPSYVTLTAAGLEVATPLDIVDEDDLRETVYARVGGPKTKILRTLVDVYPDALSRDELGERTDYSPTSGGFNNLLGSLRTVGLIDYPQRGWVVATDALFLEGGA